MGDDDGSLPPCGGGGCSGRDPKRVQMEPAKGVRRSSWGLRVEDGGGRVWSAVIDVHTRQARG